MPELAKFSLLLWIILKKEAKKGMEVLLWKLCFCRKTSGFNSLFLQRYEYLSVSRSIPLYFSYS